MVVLGWAGRRGSAPVADLVTRMVLSEGTDSNEGKISDGDGSDWLGSPLVLVAWTWFVELEEVGWLACSLVA